MSVGEQELKLRVDNIEVTLVRKRIKHMYLRIYPPDGRVVVTASDRFSREQVKTFVAERKAYIEAVRTRQAARAEEQKQALSNGGIVYLWGEPYLLQLDFVGSRSVRREPGGESSVDLRSNRQQPVAKRCGDRLIVRLAGCDLSPADQHELTALAITELYRQEVKAKCPVKLSYWEKKMGLSVSTLTVRQMRSRWGSCRPDRRRITLSLYLAALPGVCLDYVLVHELAHLKISAHNRKFYALVDRYFPRRGEAEAILQKENYLIL